jgi:ribonuclease HI
MLQVDGTPGSPPRGQAGIGIVVRGAWGQILTTRCIRAPALTSNAAEYQALIAGLTLMLDAYPTAPVRCVSDSKVIVDQLNGVAAIRAPQLIPLYHQARELLRQFAQIKLIAIPRELNQLADALAWEALGGRSALIRFGS